jgi:hypothetical protein
MLDEKLIEEEIANQEETHEKKTKVTITTEKRRSNTASLYVLSYIINMNIFKNK